MILKALKKSTFGLKKTLLSQRERSTKFTDSAIIRVLVKVLNQGNTDGKDRFKIQNENNQRDFLDILKV